MRRGIERRKLTKLGLYRSQESTKAELSSNLGASPKAIGVSLTEEMTKYIY
jgi:hypothetical protein